MIQQRGLMLVLSSPSGAGKTTISRQLLERDGGIEMSISATSRKPRPGEVDGEDYIFVSSEVFSEMRDRDAFLEWALVFDNFYGTPKEPVEQALAAGRDVLFDIDWQGAEKLSATSRQDLVTIFLLPPSVEALAERLRSRAQDTAEVVARRMAGAANEIQHWDDYDYVIVNHDIEDSVEAARAILAAERLKRTRRTGLEDFVRKLQRNL
jgi:guanylate kinase